MAQRGYLQLLHVWGSGTSRFFFLNIKYFWAIKCPHTVRFNTHFPHSCLSKFAWRLLTSILIICRGWLLGLCLIKTSHCGEASYGNIIIIQFLLNTTYFFSPVNVLRTYPPFWIRALFIQLLRLCHCREARRSGLRTIPDLLWKSWTAL